MSPVVIPRNQDPENETQYETLLSKMSNRIKVLENALASTLTKKDLLLFLLNKSVVEQMPLVFDNSTKFTDLSGICGGCGKNLLPQNFRGYFYDVDTKTKAFTGVGICDDCVELTRFSFTLHDDISVTYDQ